MSPNTNTPPNAPNLPPHVNRASQAAELGPELQKQRERHETISRALGIAEGEKHVKLDPALREWLIAIVEPQDDGSEQFLPPGIEHVADVIRAAEADTGKALEAAKQRSAKEMTTFFDGLRATLEKLKSLRPDGLDSRDVEEVKKALEGLDPTKIDHDLRLKINEMIRAISGHTLSADTAKELYRDFTTWDFTKSDPSIQPLVSSAMGKLLDAAKYPLQTDDAIRAIEDFLKREDEFRSLRSQATDILFEVSVALGKGASLAAFKESIEAKGIGDPLHGIVINLITKRIDASNGITPDKIPVDEAFLKDFSAQVRMRLFMMQEAVHFGAGENFVKIIQKKLHNEQFVQKDLLSGISAARREFNRRFGGSDAETVLNFAAVGKTVDFPMLEKQMRAFGWTDGDEKSRIAELKAHMGAGNDRYDLKDDADKKKLTDFIEKKITPNPNGVSLSLLSDRATQVGILQEWTTEACIENHVVSGKVELPNVIAEVKKAFPGFALTEDELRREAGIPADNSVDDRTTEKLAVAIVKGIEPLRIQEGDVLAVIDKAADTDDLTKLAAAIKASLKADISADLSTSGLDLKKLAKDLTPDEKLAIASLVRGAQVKEITGKDETEDLSYSRIAKNYAGDAWRVLGTGADLWIEWMKTLPQDVLKSDIDEELLASIKRENDLEAMMDAVSGIATIDAAGKTESGHLFTDAVDASLEKDVKEFDPVIKALVAASMPEKPATNARERMEQARHLLEVGQFVWRELMDRTCFGKVNDPIIRERAFFIAMHYGVEEANIYLRSPDAYAITSEDKMAVAQAAELRLLNSREAGGDFLAPLQKHGLSMDPRAVFILACNLGPGCKPMTLDCPADGKALRLILRGNPAMLEELIKAYYDKVDQPHISVEEARRIIDGMKEELARQDDDLQYHLDAKGDKRFDPITAINTGWEAVKGMMQGDTFAERALGYALVGGSLFALVKAWPKHWKLIMTPPMLLAANVALKRATGTGIADFFNLHYMKEKDRNASREQFLRRARFMEGYESVESDAGRAAVDALTDPDNPIPVGELLKWRRQMDRFGPSNYAKSAPGSLKIGKVKSAMGEYSSQTMKGEERTQAAYKIAFDAFEALCIDVARARGLGGVTAREQADAGADYIRRFYTTLAPDCATKCLDQPVAQKMCGLPPCKCYTMREILTLERPPDWMQKPMETWTEYAFNKTGLAGQWLGDRAEDGLTMLERRKMMLEDDIPEYWDWTKTNVMKSYDAFMDWARVTYPKLGKATWLFLTNGAKDIGLAFKVHAPGVIEWTFDTGMDIAHFSKEKALAFWRELHRYQIVGNTLEGFESFFESVFGSIEEANEADLAKRETISASMKTLLDAVSPGPENALKIEGWLNEALKGADTPGEILMRTELLKREVFSYLAAQRIAEIAHSMGDTTNGYRPGQHYFTDLWPVKMKPVPANDGWIKFESSRGTDVTELYEYIRSRYSNGQVLALIGQERTIIEGGLKAYVAQNPGTTSGKVAGFADAVMGWALKEKSSEYMKHDYDVYVGPLKAKAKEKLSAEQYAQYEAYLDTLMTNVVMESVLEENAKSGGPRDITLSIDRAAHYLAALTATRGTKTPDAEAILGDRRKDFLPAFDIADRSEPHELTDVRSHPRGKWMLIGAEAPDEAQAQVTTSRPTPPPETVNARRDAADAAAPSVAAETFDPQAPDKHLRALHDASPDKAADIEATVLKTIASLEDLRPVIDALKNADIPQGKMQLQNAVNHAAVKLSVMSGSAIQALVQGKAPRDAGEKQKWITEIGELYEHTTGDTQDAFSLALEYLLSDGKDYTLEQYNAILKSKGLPELPPAESSLYDYFGLPSIDSPSDRIEKSIPLSAADLATVLEDKFYALQ